MTLRRIVNLACVLLAVMTVPAWSSAAEWGDLTGQFVYDGDAPKAAALDGKGNADFVKCDAKEKLVDESLVVDPASKGIANVLVYVRSLKVTVHPDYAKTAKDKVAIDNNLCRFKPRLVPLVVTQTLEIKNSDDFNHNSKLEPLGDQAINPLIPAGGSVTYNFGKKQAIPVPVVCNIHPWMGGHVIPRDNPYFAVTDKDGKFTIKNLPAGELEFQAWHERSGYLAVTGWTKGQFKLKIAAGDNKVNAAGVVKVPAKLLEKK